MNVNYSINDVLDFAIALEGEGIQFYSKISSKVNNDKLKDLFSKLKSDELEHQKIFEDLLKKNKSNKVVVIYDSDVKKNYREYVHSFIKDTIFDEDRLDDLIVGFKNTKAIIDYALEKEKDSIEYYKSLKEIFFNDEPFVIDKIIKEEYTHIDKLIEYMKE